MAKKKKSTEFNRILLYGVIAVALIIAGYYGFKSVSGSSAAGISLTTVDLSASLDPTSPSARILTPTDADNVVARFKFKATGSGFAVKTLTILLPNKTEGGQTISGWESADIVGLEFKNEQGQTTTNGMQVSGESTKFTDLSMYVPQNTTSILTVLVDPKTVGSQGYVGEFGARIKAGLASGIISGDFYAVSDNGLVVDTKVATKDIYAAEHVCYKSKPAIEAYTEPGGLAPDQVNGLYKFKVSADTAGEIAIKKFTFAITIIDANGSSSNVTLSDFKFYRNNTDITGAGAQITNITTATPVTIESTNFLKPGRSTVQVAFGNTPATAGEQAVAPGTNVQYYLLAKAGTGFAAGDSISVTLLGDPITDPGIHYNYLSDLDLDLGVQQRISLQRSSGIQLVKSANFIWSDKSVLSHAPTFDDDGVVETSSADWTQGYLIPFPSAPRVLSL